MGAYEVLKSALLQHAPERISPGALVFFASALSVVASSSVRAPLDMIKTRVQADASITAAAAVRSAWAGGVSSIYRGAGLGLMRDVPFFGCNLLLYEQLKGIAGFLTNPADVLKTRVQSGAAANLKVAFTACVADGGLGSLMRGAGLRVAWIAPQGCIYYPAYEAVQRFLAGGGA